jgi:hypothetical protein
MQKDARARNGSQGKDGRVEQRFLEILDRRWRPILAAVFFAFAAYLLATRWANIHNFVLNDTDDNMRIAQVRAWLNDGQGWFDLRQYRLDWPEGANIHWSRLVDLPIAGLILLGRLFTDGPRAEQFAVAIAPLIPLQPRADGSAAGRAGRLAAGHHLPVLRRVDRRPILSDPH